MKSVISVLFSISIAFSSDIPKNNLNEKLDYESQQCMKCHNGSGGHFIAIRESDSPIEYDNLNRTQNHSLGMNYINTFRKDTRHFVSPASLNPKVLLIDGKVGCLSCHVAKNRTLASNSISFPVDGGCSYDKQATQEAFKNGLCNQCHQK